LQRAHEIIATNPDVMTGAVDWMKVLADGVFWEYIALPLAVVATQVSRVLPRARRVARGARS